MMQEKCDCCNGRGYHEVYYDDSEIVKGESPCTECNGTGFVDVEDEPISSLLKNAANSGASNMPPGYDPVPLNFSQDESND